MTVRTEDVIGGLIAAIDAIRPEPGEFLVLRLENMPAPESLTILQEWLKDNLADTPALVATPGSSVTTLTPEELGWRLWGSDCGRCGNTTHGSQRCDQCNSTKHTRKLWVEK
jgi:hypothetical protein